MKCENLDEAKRVLERFHELYEVVGEKRHDRNFYPSAVVHSFWLQTNVGVNIPFDIVKEYFMKELEETREKLRDLGLTDFEP